MAPGLLIAGSAVLAAFFVKRVRVRRSFVLKQAALGQCHGQEVTIFGIGWLEGVTGVLDAAPPVADYVRLRRNDGRAESIFVGDIWQLRDAAGNPIGQW